MANEYSGREMIARRIAPWNSRTCDIVNLGIACRPWSPITFRTDVNVISSPKTVRQTGPAPEPGSRKSRT
jgi:hypothetical protein